MPAPRGSLCAVVAPKLILFDEPTAGWTADRAHDPRALLKLRTLKDQLDLRHA